MRANDSHQRFLTAAAVAAIALALAAAPRPAAATDTTVVVHEVTLQKFLSTLGSVGVQGGASATVQYPYPGICTGTWGIPYPCIKWGSCQAQYSYGVSVSNLSARIVPTGVPLSATGHAQASAGICGIAVSASYTPAVDGTLGATWSGADQELRLAMQTLNVELYVSLLGRHITLGWVDLASRLPNPLYRQRIDVAKSFDLPAPISKTIDVSVQSPNLALMPGYLQLTTDVVFTATAAGPGA